MKTMILAVMLSFSGIAAAQSTPPQRTDPSDVIRGSASGFVFGLAVSPTMRREQLRRAEAFRIEVAALQSSDGGTLTAEHLAYVEGKANAIRTFRYFPDSYRCRRVSVDDAPRTGSQVDPATRLCPGS